MSRRSRSLNLLEPQEPLQACSGKTFTSVIDSFPDLRYKSKWKVHPVGPDSHRSSSSWHSKNPTQPQEIRRLLRSPKFHYPFYTARSVSSSKPHTDSVDAPTPKRDFGRIYFPLTRILSFKQDILFITNISASLEYPNTWQYASPLQWHLTSSHCTSFQITTHDQAHIRLYCLSFWQRHYINSK